MLKLRDVFCPRVAVILILFIQLAGNAVCGRIIESFLEENLLEELLPGEEEGAALPEAEANESLPIEPPPIEGLPPDEEVPKEVEQQESTDLNESPPDSTSSSLCKKCTEGGGCTIKQFHQYNYYYPHGKYTVESESSSSSTPKDLPQNDHFPQELLCSPCAKMTNDINKVSVETSCEPSIDIKLHKEASDVPNTDLSDEFKSGFPQSSKSYAESNVDQETVSEKEEALPEESSAVEISKPTQDADSCTSGSCGNDDKSKMSYLARRNIVSENAITHVDSCSNSNSQAQQESVSWSKQSKSLPIPSLQKRWFSSSLPNVKQQTFIVKYGDENGGTTHGVGSYIQSNQFSVSSSPSYPVAGYPRAIFGPNSFQYVNPPPIYDIPGVSTAYSVVI